jgi:uncharacterized repeat protein (TIGR01451 family)
MDHKLSPRYVSLICAATAALVGVLALLWIMGSAGVVAHAATISYQQSAVPQGGFALSSQPSTIARRPSADLPPGASVEWWATVQEQLRRDMPLSSLSITAPWTASGETLNSYFGFSVATAGDVNGDGYADVVVGAHLFANSLGKVYVYHGSAMGLSATPDFGAAGESSNNSFGGSVATAGDVNGDGYADVVVGAPGYHTSTGKVNVYYGSPSGLVATPTFSVTGVGINNWFGSSVATAGDVNGDGYSDIIIGATGYDNYRGQIAVYYGSPAGLSTTGAFTAVGEYNNDIFGVSVATAGDVNGDGYADVIVGAARYPNGGGSGIVYIYYGSATGLKAPAAFVATGENTGDWFGLSTATAGDVNGDGYAEVIVGAPYYGSGRGKMYVYRGSATGLSTTVSFTATGENAGDWLGNSVATAGDVNGDGYAGVIVGAPGYDSNRGKVYIYRGSATGLSATTSLTIAGEVTSTRLGYSVATAGDVNGDGYADIIAGAPDYNSNQGKAYVYHGAADGLGALPAFTALGETSNSYFGTSVTTAGDVNGDGYADVAVGAYGYNSSRGRVYVYHGSAAGLSATPAFSATGENAGDIFGALVATAGDVNGDGYADIIVGAPSTRKVYLYHGSPTGLSATAAFTAIGDYLGSSIASAGDVNGDGYSDIIVGATDYDNNRGKVTVFYGSPTGLNATAAFTAVGAYNNDIFGVSAASAGDVNGDGYADVVVGAARYPNGNGRGAIYIYHGSATGLKTSGFFTTGENAGDWLGLSTATAGDVNGDGYADVVVGAPFYDSNRGKVYVYRGSATGLSTTASFAVTGEATGDRFGDSVATAGDVNGDGYADVIIGAGYDDDARGKAYGYLGSVNGLSATPAFTATGEDVYNHFSGYAATAGDVNGDGYADVIIGAPRYTYPYNSNAGKVYVYQGNGGTGLALRPRQMRSDGSVHIAPLGKSDSTSTVQLRLTGHMPLGREKVKLEWQVAPLGTPFTSTSVISGTSVGWTDTLTAGAVITQNVSGLTPGMPYHWRIRLRYRPGNLLGQSASRWLTVPWNGWTEQDFRTPANEVNLAIAKSATPATALPGAPLTYTLRFSNTGNIAASGVLITDVIPVSVSNTSVASSGVAITRTPGITYAWQVADLAPGQGGIITLTGVLSSPLAAGTFVNTATIASATTETVTSDNRSSASLTVLNVAPVAVDDTYSTAEDTPLTIAATGVLSNDTDLNGDGLAAALVDDVLTGTLALSLDGGFVYTPALDYDGAVTFTYRATDGLVLSNLAAVTITVLPASEADLSISKSSLRAGTSITYTIVATNGGPGTAVGAAVFDPVPPGIADFTWSCAAAGGAACGDASGDGGISQTVSLPTGGAVTYTVTGTLVISGATIVNTATIAVPLGVDDPSPGDNQAVNYSGSQLYLPIVLENH